MNQRWRVTVSSYLLIFVTVISPESAAGRDGPDAPDGPHREERERVELLRYARATWNSLDAMTGASGLPSDRLCLNDGGEWAPSSLTSPTDIACYVWSVLAARSLGLIDDADADRRLEVTLTTLARMDSDHGFFFNLIHVGTGAHVGVGGDKDRPPRPFLSSVDNAWLAAALMMVRNTRPALRGRADALLAPMDFGFFYVPFDPSDPVNRPGQLHGGYYTDDRTFTTFYGMLNTEPRVISYIAIARRQVPPEHYFRLFRTYPVGRGPQKQVPRGVIRNYLGVPVFEGHYEFRGLKVVPSWGGSMFEALMVPLFVPEEQWAPGSWGVNHPLYVRAQIEEGLNVRHYGFWGFSPSSTPEGGYQNYGVTELGTSVDGYETYEIASAVKPKGGIAVGPAQEGVVTPHASFLALRYARREALDNLRGLSRTFPILDNMGFHDSVNLTTGAVSHSVLSLDQGMIMAAIANALADDAMRRAFTEGPIEAAIRPLIAPEQFTAEGPARDLVRKLH